MFLCVLFFQIFTYQKVLLRKSNLCICFCPICEWQSQTDFYLLLCVCVCVCSRWKTNKDNEGADFNSSRSSFSAFPAACTQLVAIATLQWQSGHPIVLLMLSALHDFFK